MQGMCHAVLDADCKPPYLTAASCHPVAGLRILSRCLHFPPRRPIAQVTMCGCCPHIGFPPAPSPTHSCRAQLTHPCRHLPTWLRVQGHRPGAYVRLRFSGLPCELVEHFDPRMPLLAGGLQQGEEAVGYMQLRLKRHRWFPKLLKNRDPLILSGACNPADGQKWLWGSGGALSCVVFVLASP